jgi:hypothetical protein
MLVIGSLVTIPAQAQVSLNINIGSQPQWGPTGYDHVDYYYLPDVESYYYVPTRKFIYYSGNTWVHSSYLPGRYRNYDLYGGRKYVINSPRPYLRHNTYRTRYVSNYGRPYYAGGRGRTIVRHNNYNNRNHYSRNNYGRNNYSGNNFRGSQRYNNRPQSFGNHDNRGRGNAQGNHGNPGRGHSNNYNHGGRGNSNGHGGRH